MTHHEMAGGKTGGKSGGMGSGMGSKTTPKTKAAPSKSTTTKKK